MAPHHKSAKVMVSPPESPGAYSLRTPPVDNFLEVRASEIHGKGLFTTVFIPAGRRVIDYDAEVINEEERVRRSPRYKQRSRVPLFFQLEADRVLDVMNPDAGDWFYANHSCNPNMWSKVYGRTGSKKMLLYAKRDIQPGEELTFDYTQRRIYRA
uniref:SET domain-containing protein n=1 Tax=Panagrellus redivivus TaxID=6233 RepID=A0A7E4V8C7_PANRE